MKLFARIRLAASRRGAIAPHGDAKGGAHRDAPRNVEASLERGRRGAGRPVENILPRDDFDLEFVEPVDDELEDSDDEVRPTRSASGRRRRGGRKPVDSPARSLPEDEDAVEDEIDELSDDDEEGSSAGPKHRNIPTWSDSLESIIQANTENHKRNEGRGGPRGGGRSRGRR